ncbi:MAG: hypothetical protein HKN42_11955 [Granulosicoccus sp.]|nr:hypothetical protein [Granulosicoccus sp.]
MSAKNLARLEKLSEKRAVQSCHRVNRKRLEVDQLERQHDELSAINQEYQAPSVNGTALSPQILAHRRAFVTRLTEKLELLKTQKLQHHQQLQQDEDVHRQHEAQKAAIISVHGQRQAEEGLLAGRREQRLSDEAYQMASAGSKAQRDQDERS